jgi:hypothetical protein
VVSKIKTLLWDVSEPTDATYGLDRAYCCYHTCLSQNPLVIEGLPTRLSSCASAIISQSCVVIFQVRNRKISHFQSQFSNRPVSVLCSIYLALGMSHRSTMHSSLLSTRSYIPFVLFHQATPLPKKPTGRSRRIYWTPSPVVLSFHM